MPLKHLKFSIDETNCRREEIMIPLSGYPWEITISDGEKRRVVTEGPNIEEAISESRRLYGNKEIFKVKYLPFRKEQEE